MSSLFFLPFSSELENFISHKYLSMMRNGALIINAARGKLLDEGALLQVIEERNVFAALDVFSSEPLAQFSPLLHAKNIITTPHIAAATVESYQQTGIHVAQSIIDYFAGREIKKCVVSSANKDFKYKKNRNLYNTLRFVSILINWLRGATVKRLIQSFET